MVTLFDEQQVMEAYSHEVYNDGIVEGEMKKVKETAYRLQRKGMSLDEIAETVDVSSATVSKWLSEPHAAPAM